MVRTVKVYDIETIVNCILYMDVDKSGSDITTFVIHKDLNQIKELITYLKSGLSLVGFNNINFDSQLIHFILDNEYKFLRMDGEKLARTIFDYGQVTIGKSNRGEFLDYPEWKSKIPQLDLFRVWHFDNKAKSTSLKALQVSLRWYNVMDMPIPHDRPIDISLLPTLIEYCKNDIEFTLEFYKESKKAINLRLALGKTFGLNLINANDPKLGAEIFCKLLSDDMKIPAKELKKMRTHRDSIDLGSCILPYVSFDTPEFKDLYNYISNRVITQTKGAFKKKITINGVEYSYGTGGIHASAEPGIYEASTRTKMLDIDVKSFYPKLGIENDLKPEHLGEAFTKIYNWIYNERQKYGKSDPLNSAFKLMLNGTYGKSNEATSFFYDPLYTMTITINGQLLITMLIEKCLNAGAKVLQANTDGITIMYDTDLDAEILRICKDWEILTRLELEYFEYSKMVIRDVNSYFAVYTDGKIKQKGIFITEPEYHKDPSFLIVPKMLLKYYTTPNLNIREEIESSTDLFDFLGRQRFTKDSRGELRRIRNGELEIDKQQKTTRYYVSTDGDPFIKVYSDGGEEQIEKGYKIQVVNVVNSNKIPDNLNYNYYIDEIYKNIEIISPSVRKTGVVQMSLGI